jgi:hypothetical protein
MTDEMKMLKFVQLTKVDAKTGEVWGVISSETPDDSNEIMDYEHSKPNFLKWSDKIVKASGGKSRGNVRTMHNGQMDAVGKLTHFEARDDTKDFYVGAQIVDKEALAKVYAGVFTGFSIGGSYGAWQTKDGAFRRYEAIPVEVSLVDSPCNPDATFQMVKEDGVEELRKFVTTKGEPMSDIPQPEVPAIVEDPKPITFDELLAKADPATLKEYADKLSKAIKPDDLQKVEAVPAAPAAEDKGGAATEPNPADDGKAVVPAPDALRAAILAILEELGLVVKEGQAMKAVVATDLQKSALALDLVKADFVKQKDELKLSIEAGDKALAGDIAKLIEENEQLSKRVSAVTGMGPVVMVQGAGATEQAAQHEIEVLRKYQQSARTPEEVAKFGELIATAEIRAIQNPKKGQ